MPNSDGRFARNSANTGFSDDHLLITLVGQDAIIVYGMPDDARVAHARSVFG